MRPSKPGPLPIIALAEWLLILPASFFLGAAALRLLQPRQYEPARTSWIIFEWTTTHISHLEAGILFLAIPCLVVIAGCVTLAHLWRKDEALRQDLAGALAILRRQRAILFLTTALVVGGGVLAFAVAHVITD